MILFIICCVLLGLIVLTVLGAIIYTIIDCGGFDIEVVFISFIIIVLAAVLAIFPIIGVVEGIEANGPTYVEATYQAYKAEYDTLCAALANDSLSDIAITNRVVEYNTTVAYYKTMRQSKWRGYFYNAAFDRLELIDY